ncbi:MAG: hypothetical protein ASARMPREDX12_005655 [Alectoria sarmentosa]|nr:MAG: hypothetical protein ASARMPREDX12_005655 [Alectoria sarmentosa]
MANHIQPIFRLPSFFLSDDMPSTEYCHPRPFRASSRPAVARALHYGSTPDFSFNFTNDKDSRYLKPKCSVIGSRRPQPKLREIIAMNSNSPDISTIMLANANLTKPKISKFAKFFPPSEPHGETATGKSGDESSHTVPLTSTHIIPCRHPKVEPHGDMSNLRPHDPGMDAATCVKLYHLIDEDASAGTGSKKVTFDLGARFATRSTPEQKTECRNRAHGLINEEGSTMKNTRSSSTRTLEVFSDLGIDLTFAYLNNGGSSFNEQMAFAEDDEIEGDETEE